MLPALNTNSTCKYLGISQNNLIDHSSSESSYCYLYRQRYLHILKTKLAAKSEINAVNTCKVLTLTYSMGIIKWPGADLNKPDRLTLTHDEVQNASS